MEGNSIYKKVMVSDCCFAEATLAVLSTHQTLVLGEEHGDSSVDLADSQ